jgi:hypothetical protein
MPRPTTRLTAALLRSIETLYNYVNPRNNAKAPLIAEDVYQARAPLAPSGEPKAPHVFRRSRARSSPQAVKANAARLDAAMEARQREASRPLATLAHSLCSAQYSRDYDYDYFGFKARRSAATSLLPRLTPVCADA